MATTGFSAGSPPIFSGVNYPVWAVKMRTYLKAFDLWESIESGEAPVMRHANPTLAQIKQHNEDVAKTYKALIYLQSAVSESIFAKIMNYEDPKVVWDSLKEEYQGSDRTRTMQVLNLSRQFELMKMKEEDSIQDYTDKLLRLVNELRQLGEDVSDKRVVNKILVSILERFEAKISSLEILKI
ncbi:protein of unknown function DUF4219 - like 5 [Theobroma cacao]|nr:protein of unknown function DUF4219 - like 5 [Theobroma cacao]